MMEKSAKLPRVVQERISLFDSFIRRSHFVNKTLLSSLSYIVSTTENTTIEFEKHHRDDTSSNTTLVLLHYPKQTYEEGAGHNHHTDIGSLTLLFTEQWGLQLKAPGEDEWDWVAPRDGHAIINVGDSLRFLSGQRFNSCLHRVIPVSGDEDRYSIAYFLRPDNRLEFKDADGATTTARAWHDGKYVMFAEPHEKQRLSNVLTGGMEKNMRVAVA
jgi:isopenicillin N synthase-like dioxygenase